jgi:protease-4
MDESLLDDVFAHVTADLAKDRGIPAASWQGIFDNGPYTAKEAGAAHVVDAVGEPTELDEKIAAALDGHHYAVSDGDPAERSDAWSDPMIAVVYIEGDIVDGKSRSIPLLGEDLVGGDTIVAALAAARDDDRVKAIVLRIDSPGGSSLASELIARAVKATRAVKPVIVSMGDVAASGGYFAAAYGAPIYAEPSTITGSIGIFSGKFDLSGLLGGKIGITWEVMKKGARADMESYLRPYTDEEQAALKEKLRYYYEEFTGAVADGRGMKQKDVDDIGRGHVWTGAQAMPIHLIDKYGNIIDAIEEAKRQGGLDVDERARILELPAESSSFVATLLRLAGVSARDRRESTMFDGLAIPAQLMKLVPGSLVAEPPGTIQARLPFVIDWGSE